MGEDGSSRDCSWKKLVIAKTNNEWISKIKSRNARQSDEMNTSDFSLDDVHIPFTEIKVENEVLNFSSSYQDGESSDAGMSGSDPLLEPIPKQRRRRKGSGPRTESPEERRIRLAKMSAYAAQRLANESPEQRALRLKRMSEYAAKRLSRETSDQRAKRLARMSAYAAKRLAEETPEQRQARLARMSAYAAYRQAMKKSTDNIQKDEST